MWPGFSGNIWGGFGGLGGAGNFSTESGKVESTILNFPNRFRTLQEPISASLDPDCLDSPIIKKLILFYLTNSIRSTYLILYLWKEKSPSSR